MIAPNHIYYFDLFPYQNPCFEPTYRTFYIEYPSNVVLLCFGSYFSGNGRKQGKIGEITEFWYSDAGSVDLDAGSVSLGSTGAEISASELKTVITFDS